MITDAEVRRLARLEGVEPRIVELDYALGWALRGIASHQYLAHRPVFKGGTCIRKCYFAAYRFSEDLDFTATQRFNEEELTTALAEAFAETRIVSGIDFRVQEPRLRVIDDEYGRESIRFTVYWRGPHTMRGSPRGLRLDVTWNEVLAFAPQQRAIFHPFSDAAEVEDVRVPCYALEEVMCEKIRSRRCRQRSMPERCLMMASRGCLHDSTSSELIGNGIWSPCFPRARNEISTTCGRP